MALPEKIYDRLQSMPKRWELSQEDVYYFVENDLLRVCVWMPLRYMERCAIKKKQLVYEEHERQEGFIGIRPEDFHRICSTGRAKLRIFRSVRSGGHVLRMAYEPPQPALSVRIHDLVVLREDRLAFEETYEIKASKALVQEKQAKLEFCASADYRTITINGEEFHLGDVQSRIVEQLHDALQSRTQWVHGKTLIHGANSKAIRMRDIFKSKHDWNKIIASNGRGYYRLNVEHESDRSKQSIQTQSMAA